MIKKSKYILKKINKIKGFGLIAKNKIKKDEYITAYSGK